MPLALIMSSYVASSRVGGFVQALALAQFKIDPILVPTVVFGRHPGWGAPGGAALSIETFEGVLAGVEANGLFGFADLVITGYFSSAAQVLAAAGAIDAVRARRSADAHRPKALVIVDPIMGDTETGLYVSAEVAEAIVEHLVPRADLISPNAWELERLTGMSIRDADEARRAARSLNRPVLVSSVPQGEEIGVVYADQAEAWLAAHARAPKVPSGTGDLLVALFAAAMVESQPISYALTRSVGAVAECVAAALDWKASELPVAAMGARLQEPSALVRIQRLS